jgi:hypothetical protein
MVIHLAEDEGLIAAIAWPWPNRTNPVPGNRHVLNYSQTWTLVTAPGARDPTFTQQTFARASTVRCFSGRMVLAV